MQATRLPPAIAFILFFPFFLTLPFITMPPPSELYVDISTAKRPLEKAFSRNLYDEYGLILYEKPLEDEN